MSGESTEVEKRTPGLREGRGERERMPGEGEEDVLFKAQMALAQLVLGYWKVGLGILGVALVASLVIGNVLTARRDAQRDASSRIAKIDRDLPEPSPLFQMGMGPMDDLADGAVVSKLEESARAYEVVGSGARGAAGAQAWLRAADTWQRANRPDEALAAFEKAHAVGASGVLGWGAAAGVATGRAAKGDTDGAAAIWKALAAGEAGHGAERALFELGTLYESAGRKAEAITAFEEFAQKYPDSKLGERVGIAMARLKAGASG